MWLMIVIGWRNLWRNKRRSIIMLGALIVGLWGLVMMYAANRGWMLGMVDMAILSHSAHIQVHAKGYSDDPDITLSMKDPDKILADIKGIEHIRAAAPRGKVLCLVSTARASAGIMAVGIDPEKEAGVTSVRDSIKQGAYFDSDYDPAAPDKKKERQALIGESLAKKLKVEPGRKIVIYARGTDRELHAIRADVAGIFKTGSEEVDKFMVFIRLPYFQKSLGMDTGAHEVAIRIDDERNLDAAESAVASAVSGDGDLEVMTWRDAYAFLVQITDMVVISNYILLFIVGISVSLGIANTMIMSVFERFREIGIMRAVGTRPIQIFTMVLVESISLAMVGILAGSALAQLTLMYWDKHGLDLSIAEAGLASFGMPTVIYPLVYSEDWIMTWIAIVIFAVGSSIYPAVRAALKNPVEAIRL